MYLSSPAEQTLSYTDRFTFPARLLSGARRTGVVRAAPGSDGANTKAKLRRHLDVVTFGNICLRPVAGYLPSCHHISG